MNSHSALCSLRFALAFVLSAFLLSCSGVTKNDDGTVTTTYGFNAVDAIAEFGTPDSMRVVVLKGSDTLSNTLYMAQDLDGDKLFFDITVAENAQVRVLYHIYTGGVAVGAGDQTFVSGETPTVPRPALKPRANAGTDTLLARGVEFKYNGTVELRAEQAKGYAWDYEGDGRFDDSIALNKGFVYTYPDTGIYTAVFRVTGSYGLYDDDTLQVRVQNPPPVIQSLSVARRVTVGNDADLEVKAASAFGSIVNYEWDLGGDGTWDTAGVKLDYVVVRMLTVGDWKAKVRVTDSEGKSVLDSATIEVSAKTGNLPPEISLLFQTDSVVSIKDAVGWRVDFSDGNTRADVVKFEWDLDGDGVYETVKTTPDSLGYTYSTAGAYTIRVKITDAGGESAIKSQTLRVVQGEPTVSLAVSKASAGIAEAVTFNATASDGNEAAKEGSIAKYEWDFDGDGTYDKTTTEPTATFAYPDAYASHVYTAKVRVTDDDGNMATATQAVTVANRAPVLSAINVSQSPVSISKPSVLKVNAADFTDPDDNSIDEIVWSFSDGAASRTLGRSDTLWLVRATAQTVTVTATVKDKYGLSASKSADVVVSEGSVNVTGAGDVVTVINAQVTLNPTVSFTLGQTLASCRWNVNGAGFGKASASCATTLTMPGTPYSNYKAVYEATSDVGTQTVGTIKILVRNGFTDPRDGETYPVVTYSYASTTGAAATEHTWMAENLNYSGHTGANLGAAGKAYTTGWCYGVGGNRDTTKHQDSVTCDNGYGRLYRWNDAMGLHVTYNNACYVAGQYGSCGTPSTNHQGICPEGWHVPSDEEWTAFTNFVEAQDAVASNAGAWLKAVVAGNTSWNNTSNNQQDPFGFSALPAGGRDGSGNWSGRGSVAFFWSASEGGGSSAWGRYLDNNYASVSRYSNVKNYGYPLRCLQD